MVRIHQERPPNRADYPPIWVDRRTVNVWTEDGLVVAAWCTTRGSQDDPTKTGGVVRVRRPIGSYEGAVPQPLFATSPRPLGQMGPTLVVHVLGRSRVTLNNTSVDKWPSRRGRSLFMYLLTHRDPWPSRETLMDAFWPNSSHEAARNCLNVAVHGLRRALRAAVDVPVVVQVRGTYLLHPNIWLWLDVEEFEHHVARGRELEESDGDPTRATAELDLAASLYQGDFLADHPYEEWSVSTESAYASAISTPDSAQSPLPQYDELRHVCSSLPADYRARSLSRGCAPPPHALLQPARPTPSGSAPVLGMRGGTQSRVRHRGSASHPSNCTERIRCHQLV